MAVKKPNIGELREVGHFENNTGKIAYTAGYVDGYSNIITSVWCKLWQGNTRRVNEFGKIEIVSGWQMVCRFQSAIDVNIKANTKFVRGNDRFTVAGWEVIDAKKFYYHFHLNMINA